MILMLFKRHFLKEIVLPDTDNPDYRIMMKSSFGFKKPFFLRFEIRNGSFTLLSSSGYNILSGNLTVESVALSDGAVITLSTYDKEIFRAAVFDRQPEISPCRKFVFGRHEDVTIGSGDDNTIKYNNMNLVSNRHCVIKQEGSRRVIYDTSSNGLYLNNKAVSKRAVLSFGDTIEVFGLRILYFGEVFSVMSRIGEYTVSDRLEKFRPYEGEPNHIPEKHREVYFNRSPRVIPSICRDKIVIEPPTTPQFTKKRPMILTIGPSLTMAIPMLLGCLMMILSSYMGGTMTGVFMYTGLITAFGSAVLGALWAFLNIRNTQKEEAENENIRFNAYGNYLIEMSDYIKDKYMSNIAALRQIYPEPLDCCSYDEHSSLLWNRNPSHADFMYYRLGVGDTDFQMEIEIPKERFSLTFDNLKDKPAMIYENYRYMRSVPVGVDFSVSSLFGITGGKYKRGVYDVVNNIITQIAATTAYTDAKIAFCADKNRCRMKSWEYIKWLPHTWSENRKFRFFATDRQETADVLFELSEVIRRRADYQSDNRKSSFRPHYFLFVFDAEMLRGELISKYIFDRNADYGITTFIMADNYSNLPNECEHILQNDGEFKGYFCADRQSNSYFPIEYDSIPIENLNSFSRKLSNIRIKENEDDSVIPQRLDFFEMYGVSSPEDFDIARYWRENRTYNSMKALIGKKAGDANVYLDIHEKYHGPHGLVAGTTGSGKSELIQTFMLSLAINYSPDDVAFFVIDFKGGGMANLFKHIPHMAGQISNLSGNQIQRAMISIKSENLRRQKLFGEYGVNNINSYTQLHKNGDAPEAIPHLLIIIDEFAELKKEQPEFMGELISVAQVGRSLGVHLILATQKPAGTVDDNIWSNAKFRICLRVQDRQDSNDMLHKPDASFITQAGRAYLQVGNDEVYELFQSGWSGAPYERFSANSGSELVTMITDTGKAALIGSYSKKKRKEEEKLKWYAFLYETINNICEDNEELYSDSRLPQRVLQAAADYGYNVGFGSSELRQVQNFIMLLPNRRTDKLEAARYISERAEHSSVKLPELKDKTQLETIVEQIIRISEKDKSYSTPKLWLEPLGGHILLKDIVDINNYSSVLSGRRAGFTLDAVVGLYDDPRNQAQLPFSVNFKDGGHLALCGSVMSGKSTFMQTMLLSFMLKYSPEIVNFYILDYSGGMLGCFESFPHTGGVVLSGDDDKADKLFNMLSKMIKERKSRLNGGSYAQFLKANGNVMPAVVLVIDNYAGFAEKTSNKYDDLIIYLSREGAGFGVYLALSSAGFGISEIPGRIGDNIKTVISLEMSDRFKYMDVLRTTRLDLVPESGISGRGIGYVNGTLLEFQTALGIDAEDDYKRNNAISALGDEASKRCKSRAALIPSIPKEPVFDDICALEEYKSALSQASLVPFAYSHEDASVYSISLSSTYCYLISGKRRTGKTNVMKLIMSACLKKDADVVLIEKDSAELRRFFKDEEFECVTDDSALLKYFQKLTPEFVERNKRKKELLEQGLADEEIFCQMQSFKPVFIFISDLKQFLESVYHPEGEIGNMSAFFENIFEKGMLHNIYFFACLNPDDSAELSMYKSYRLFTSFGAGVHLGGNVAGQRIFDFRNIPFSELSKTSKRNEALTPAEDDTIAKKLIVPLIGGRV